MKRGDINALGGLFDDFKSGWGFGSNIVDTQRQRQMQDEQRRREAALDPSRLAKAQVDAERARLEYQQLPAEHQRKLDETRTNVRAQDWREGEEGRDIRAGERKARAGLVEKLKAPDISLSLMQKLQEDPDFLSKPEAVPYVEQLRLQEATRKADEEAKLHGRKQYLTAESQIRVARESQPYRASMATLNKPSAGFSKLLSGVSSFLTRADKDDLSPKERATELTRQYNVAIQTLQQKGDAATPGDREVVDLIATQLRSFGGQVPGQPAAQPMQAAPVQAPVPQPVAAPKPVSAMTEEEKAARIAELRAKKAQSLQGM